MSQLSQPGSCSGSRAADSEYGDQPELQPASAYDSAFEEASNSVPQDSDAGSSQHQMAAADTTINTSLKPLPSSGGVHVIVEQDHTDNLVVETEDSVVAVIETRPHSEGIVSSSVPVLPEMK